MKKRINTQAIANELSEGSVFFPPPKAPESSPLPASEPQPERDQPSESMQPRHHDTVIPRHHDSTLPTTTTDIIEIVRKAVKQVGKEAATHRFTLEEKQQLADIEYTYRRQGIRTSENEITRIAINYFVEDYRLHGENSLLAKVLKKLNS